MSNKPEVSYDILSSVFNDPTTDPDSDGRKVEVLGTTSSYVAFGRKFASAIAKRDYLNMQRLLADKSIPADMMARIVRYWYTADSNFNPLELASITSVRVNQEVIHNDKLLSGKQSFTDKEPNRAESVFLNYCETADLTSDSVWWDLVWWIAYMLEFGYSAKFFGDATPTVETLELKDGTMREFPGPSRLFTSGPSGSNLTWWEVANSLPVNLKRLSKIAG